MGIVDDGEDEVDVPVVVEKFVEIKKFEKKERIQRNVIAVVLSKYLQPVFWTLVVLMMIKRYGRRVLTGLFK
jgi:hypothetical protein